MILLEIVINLKKNIMYLKDILNLLKGIKHYFTSTHLNTYLQLISIPCNAVIACYNKTSRTFSIQHSAFSIQVVTQYKSDTTRVGVSNKPTQIDATASPHLRPYRLNAGRLAKFSSKISFCNCVKDSSYLIASHV